jgi:predicted amidophosphoribosyltransferase
MSCWGGLVPLEPGRCPRCAVPHGGGGGCRDDAAWELGDALWDYWGGSPAVGALLVPGIKTGEAGWRRGLLGRVSRAALPEWAGRADLVTSAPPSPLHRLMRGFDLAEEAARLVAGALARPYARTLAKAWASRRQARKSEGRRRRMPQKTVHARRGADVGGKVVLLVDDVWTTGTTLLRCAGALKKAGAAEVMVLALFRATR